MATQEIVVRGEELKSSLGNFLSLLSVKLALDVHANLVAAPGAGGTPIDTGFASNNWRPRIRERVEAPHGTRPTAKGPSPSGLALFTDTSARDAGVASLGGYKIDMGDIYVSNPVPYIVFLNGGTSKQQPAGFVERAIVKALVEDIRK